MALVLSVSAFADPIDDIEADVSAKWDKLQSLSYDMDMSNKMSNEAMDYSMTGTGVVEMAKKDGKWNMRMENKSDTTQKVQGKETKETGTTMMVVNGEFMYSLVDANGQKMCTKSKAAQWNDMAGGKGFFKYLRTSNDLKVLPDETVSGQACYVIEATMKNTPAGVPVMAMRYYFSKSNGMMMQTVSKSADGKNNMTMTSKNMKIDPAIAADRFAFTPPAGVQVQDMSDMEAQMKKMQEDALKAAADAEKNAAAAAKKEEPKAEEKPAAKSEPAKTEPAKTEPAKAEPKKKEDKKPKIKGLGF